MHPKCYQDLIDDLEEDYDMMYSYDEILQLLDLKTISMATAWRWLINLGYKYDENKRCYYTDGHERDNAVYDRNKQFLPAYFSYEKLNPPMGAII